MRLTEISEQYDLELDRIVAEVEKQKAKKVLLQFPDGLKIIAIDVVDVLSSKISDVEFSIWGGSCFGACDVPETDDDLLIQFGHAGW